MADGRFREDLYYRLNVILINIPDLSERSEDIPLLVDHFIERFNHRMGRNVQRISEDALALLMRYPFPGNVRELENVLEHAYIVAKGPIISRKDLPAHVAKGRPPSVSPVRLNTPHAPPATNGSDTEQQWHIECLRRNRWSIPRAARELGVHRTTLWRRVRRLNIALPHG